MTAPEPGTLLGFIATVLRPVEPGEQFRDDNGELITLDNSRGNLFWVRICKNDRKLLCVAEEGLEPYLEAGKLLAERFPQLIDPPKT